jgi:hypothetical protein
MLPRFGNFLAPTPDLSFIANGGQHSASLARRPNAECPAEEKSAVILRCQGGPVPRAGDLSLPLHRDGSRFIACGVDAIE